MGIISSHRNLRAEDGGKYCISIHHESPYLYFSLLNCSLHLFTRSFHSSFNSNSSTLLFLCHATCFFPHVCHAHRTKKYSWPRHSLLISVSGLSVRRLNTPEVFFQITKVLRPILVRAWSTGWRARLCKTSHLYHPTPSPLVRR